MQKMVFLCQRYSQVFFCMADSYLLIPWSEKCFESFRDDKFFFGRWHPALGKITAQNFLIEWVIAYRIGCELTIVDSGAWLALSTQVTVPKLKAS